MIRKTPNLKFTAADSERAHAEWYASCGPHSIAAACGLTLEEVRVALPQSYRGWMSPTMIGKCLRVLGKQYTLKMGMKTQELCEGINRIQWEGNWLNPGVPERVAYFHTHYVAYLSGWVLCTACLPAEWIPYGRWRNFHLNEEPRTPFHVTHHYNLNNC